MSSTLSRAYSWEDQTATRAAGASQDGLAVLLAIGRNELPLPPALRTFGISLVGVEPGRVSLSLEPDEFHLDTPGLVHGGLLAALLHTSMSYAVYSLMPAGRAYHAAELNIRYLHPAGSVAESLTCVGEVLRSGQRSMVVQALIAEESGREIAIGGATALLEGQG